MMIFLEILGTIAFSISGAIEAMKKKMDLLGVLVLGLITAIGGGVLRDVIIGEFPIGAFRNPRNAMIALLTALVAFILGALFSKKNTSTHNQLWNHTLLLSDSVGLGAFTVLGIQCVQERTEYNSLALLLFVGVITGVGGGLLRDIFAGNVPYIFRKHVYATASIAGAISFLCLQQFCSSKLASLISLLLVVILRLLAARFEWNLPRVTLSED